MFGDINQRNGRNSPAKPGLADTVFSSSLLGFDVQCPYKSERRENIGLKSLSSPAWAAGRLLGGLDYAGTCFSITPHTLYRIYTHTGDGGNGGEVGGG